MSRRRAAGEGVVSMGGGLGGFLRSLLSGIPWSEVAERVDTLRFAPPAGGLLRVRNANGRIEVVGEERDDVSVELAKRARAESQDEARHLLDAIRLARRETPESLDVEVEVPRRWNRHGHVNLRVHVPRQVRLQCESVNGKLCVSGMRAAVGARSSNGSISVDDVVGDVDVFTANAKVACSSTCGALVARSSNGKIEIGAHRGSVDASTSNGLIRATLEALGRDGVRLATSNGRIVLELPDEVDADVDLRVDNGIVRNERELRDATRSTDGRLRGSLGRGGVPIKLRTSNGSISLR
jgi:DUF4097 and DUF4098 domain-containing protein YvlB